MNFDNQKNWPTVKFGDVVEQIKDRVPDLNKCGLKKYIRGEHFESGNIHLLSFSNLGDGKHGSAFCMRFYPGDILYVSRNPQLRKAAIAEFEGICANTTYVCRTKENKLLQGLLPFIMQSEEFVEHTTRNKRGSTNFYLNWSDISGYEFHLPPLKDQIKICKILTQASKYKKNLINLLSSTSNTLTSFINFKMRGEGLGELSFNKKIGKYHKKFEIYPLGDLITNAQYGLSKSVSYEGKYPIFRMTNLVDGKTVCNDIKYVDLDEKEISSYLLQKGDVLFNRTNSYELVGKTGIFNLDGDYTFASYLIRIITNKKLLLPEYLCAFLRNPIGRRQIMSYATRGVSQTNVNASNLKKILIPLPPISYQRGFIDALKNFDETIFYAKKQIKYINHLSREIY